MIPSSPALYITIFSLIKIGAVIVFIDPFIGTNKINLCCKKCKPKGFIGSKKANFLKLFSKNIRKIPIKKTISDLNLKHLENEELKTKETHIKKSYKHESLMFIRFTTGSTGQPKGVERTYSYTCDMIEAIQDFFPQKKDDVDMTTFSMNIFYNLINGTTTVLPNKIKNKIKKSDTKKIVKQIKKCKITTFSASPYILKKITDHCIEEKIKLSNMRFVFTGGGPPHISLIKNLNKVFSESENYIVYGSTEAFPVSWIKIDKENLNLFEETKKGKGLCLGRVHKNLQMCIIKPTNQKIQIKNQKDFEKIKNKTGEIIITGPHVATRYYNDAQNMFSKNKIIDHKQKIWHRTGDIGYIDTKNRLWMIGRINNFFETKNKTFSNLSVEYIFDSQKEIKKSAFLEKEKAILLVQIKENENKDKVKQKIEEILKKQKIPFEKIVFVKKIPLDKRHHTKVDYKKLKTKI